MGTSRTSTHGTTARKEKMEMDRTHLAKTTCQHDEKSIAVEPTGGAKTRKTKGDMEEMCGKRQGKNRKNMVRTSKGVPGQR